MSYRYDASQLREAAKGRWLDILSGLVPALIPAIDRVGTHVSCPVHGGVDGFRLFPNADDTGGGVCNTCGTFPDGFALLSWLTNLKFVEILEKIASYTGSTTKSLEVITNIKPVAPVARMSDSNIKKMLQHYWQQSLPMHHFSAVPMRTYLENRGLHTEGWENLRFHPRMPYRNGEEVSYHPVMLALVQDGHGNPVTLHRTYLTHAGSKAAVQHPKKLMPYTSYRSLSGATIQMGHYQEGILGVAEGIETSLAVQQATGMTTWATLSATFMRGFIPPKGVNQVCIWADNDGNQAGQQAAKALKDRLAQQGIEVTIQIPFMNQHSKKTDWLDVLNIHGQSGFPTIRP